MDLAAAKAEAAMLPAPEVPPDWLAEFLPGQHAAALRIVALGERVGISRPALLAKAKEIAAGARLTTDHLRQALAELT